MPETKKLFSSKFMHYFTNAVLKIATPLLNHRIIPLRWESIGGIASVKQSNNLVTIECERGFLEIKLVTPEIWRIRASKTKLPPHHFSYAAQEPSTTAKLRVIKDYDKITLKEDKNVLRGEDLIISVSEKDTTISFYRVNGEQLHKDKTTIAWSKRGSWGKISKAYPKPIIHTGFGEKTGKLAKNGRRMIFWNTDQASYGKNDDPLYQSEPLQIAILQDGSAHGIFYDNQHYSVIHPEKGKGLSSSYFTEREPICYYVFSGPNLKDVLKQIGDLNGRLPLPPRWVLGHHQCRWSYFPESRVREIAQNFRDKNIPCDSIHLDIDYMDGFRCFTWDAMRFPDPAKLTFDLHEAGFKIIAMTDPALKVDPEWDIYKECVENDYYCKLPNEEPYIGVVWPGKCVFPDFTNPRTREWWGTLYLKLLEKGIEGFWLDMAEPSTFDLRRTMPKKVQHYMDGKGGDHRDAHNIYGLQFAQATREGLDKLRKNHRNFIFVRTAYSGIQRYASSWTGDNYSNWIGLQQSIPMVMSMGLSGQTFVSVDLGGFSFDVTSELLTRWYQTGIFYPFCRNHSAKGTKDQEPWAFDLETEKIIKEAIEFRYKLLPYLYTTLWEASSFGLPMMRPLFLEFPKDKETYIEKWHNSQFMFGEKLLVAPILSKMQKNQAQVTREIYLPKGKWFDIWSNELLLGGQVIVRSVPINHMPLFVRAGTILPTNPVVQYTEKTEEHPLILKVYPDNTITGKVYLDDGITKEYENQQFNLINIDGYEAEKEINLEMSQVGKITDLPLTNNILIVQIFTPKQPIKVRVNDRTVNQEKSNDKLSWNRDAAKKIIELIIPKPSFPLSIQINYK
jgi:alpha-glucosidase